ncbi:MAG TPA: hypothetical protein PL105_23895, partial [Caldilineaceae bacterium]|nr:hypothetical protein [Caldilineaceae bacterium]
LDDLSAGGTLHQPGEADWFRLEMPVLQPQPAYLFSADVTDANLLVRMELFEADGATLLTTGFGQVLLSTPQGGGIFYLRVSNSSAYADCNSSYNLTAEEFIFSENLWLPQVVGGGAEERLVAGSHSAPRVAQQLPYTANALAVRADTLYLADGETVRSQGMDGALGWQTPGVARPQQLLAGTANLYISGWGKAERAGWIPLNPDPGAADISALPGSVIFLDPASGGVRGRIDGLDRPSGLAENGAGLWIAETGGKRLLLADSRNGQIARHIELDEAPYVLEAVTDGLFVTLPGGNRVIFVENGGTIRWQTELDGLGLPQDIAYDARRNRLYVLYLLAPRFGQVAVLDGTSGERLTTIEPTLSRPLRAAQALAVDPTSDRLLISTFQGVEQFGLTDLQPAGRLSGGWFAGPFSFAMQDRANTVWSIDGRQGTVQLIR